MGADDTVSPGQPLRISADDWNRVREICQRMADGLYDTAQGAPGRGGTHLVRVVNQSGAAVDRYGVLAVSGVLTTPATDLDIFRAAVPLLGAAPSASYPARTIVIAQQPIAVNAVGWAVAVGVTAALATFTTGSETRADFTDADTSKLKAGSSGPAEIVWSAGSTGDQWAIVKFGGGAAAGFHARISGSTATQLGTSTGDGAAPSTQWTYAFIEVEKTVAGYRTGSAAWTNKASGRTGTAHNTVEDMNTAVVAATPTVMGNGVVLANLDYNADATYEFSPRPAPAGAIVFVREVTVLTTPPTVEYWFSYENGVDGACA